MKSLLRKLLNQLPVRMRLVVETGVLLLLQRWLPLLSARRPAVYRGDSWRRVAELKRQIARDGFAVIEGYKSPEWCEQVQQDVLNALRSPALTTRHNEDVRVFGVESVCASAREFASDPLLHAMACAYARSREVLMFCMANRVEHHAGVAYGSGGEWHRDSFRFELKAMLYLTDVRETDGPFAIVRGSQRAGRIVRDLLRLISRRDGDYVRSISVTRLKDAGTHLDARDPGRAVTCTAKRGTLLLFDGSAIHTGLPPMPGGAMRLALTNYYCAQADLAAARAYYRPLVKLN